MLVSRIRNRRVSDTRYRLSQLTFQLRAESLEDRRMLTVIPVPSVTVGEISHFNERDEFSFFGEAGMAYDVSVTAGTVSDLSVVVNDVYPGRGDLTTQFVAPVDGLYETTVSSSRSTGDYAISVEAIEYSDDHGNTSSTATKMLSKTLTGSIEVEADIDYFYFKANPGFVHAIHVDSSQIDPQVKILDMNRNLISDQFSSLAGTLSWTPLAAETYLVTVELGTFGEVGSYGVRLEQNLDGDDHGGIPAAATPLSVPQTIAASIDVPGDLDFFSVPVIGGVTYAFSTETSLLNGLNLRLYDTDKTEIASSNFRLHWTAPATGTYYLALRERIDAQVGPYQLRAEIAIDEPAGDPIITFPTTINVAFDASSGRNEYAFEATTDTVYEFSSREGLPLTLLAPDCTTILAVDRYTLRWVVPSDGTYYLALNDYYDSFNFDASTSLRTDDYANAFDLALPIEVGTATNGVIEEHGDADYFSFPAVQGTEYNLFAVSVTGRSLRPDLTLYDRDGTTVISQSASEARVGGRSFLNWIAPATGNYFLGVRENFDMYFANVVGEYELSVEVYADDHGDLPATATPIVVPFTASGMFRVPGDTDVFSFSATAGIRYRIEGVADSGPIDVRLMEEDGSTIIAVDSLSGPERLGWTATEDSTLFIAIESPRLSNFRNFTLAIGTVLPCDYDGAADGCDLADLDMFLWERRHETHDVANSNIQQWLAQASSRSNPLKQNANDTYRVGDLNLDGDVDSSDLGVMLNEFGSGVGLFRGWEGGDVNGDRFVDSSDFGLLLNEFGHRSSDFATHVAADQAPSFAAKSASGWDFATESRSRSVRDVVFGVLGEEENESGPLVHSLS